MPELSMGDVSDLRGQLLRIKLGGVRISVSYPAAHLINDKLTLLADPWFLLKWEPSYPATVY
jgi:hypothetical protein